MCIQSVKPTELHGADCSLNLGHAVVPSQDFRSVAARRLMFDNGLSMITHQPGHLGDLLVISDKHTSLAARDRLGFREREDTAVADRPNGTPFIARAWRLRAVFDDFQLARACESNQRVHIGWMSEEVHRDDGPSKVRDGCGRGLWIEGKGAVIDVRENWYGVVHQYGGRCCRER